MQWAAFAYLGVVSMFLGFFAWYRGLAIGPMAQVSQIQLVQPVLSICWAGAAAGRGADLDHHHRRRRGCFLRRAAAVPVRAAEGQGGGGVMAKQSR